MNTIQSVRIYEADGSEHEYPEGTYAYYVIAVDEAGVINTYGDGGFTSRDEAALAANRLVEKLVLE